MAKQDIPAVLAREHADLLAGIAAAAHEPGVLGEAARNLASVLVPHIRNEEEFAFPPLAVLPALAEGRLPEDTVGVLEMTRRLKAELPQLLHEHRRIREAAEHLRAAAAAVNRPAFERYADVLASHAEIEDQVLYLAGLLVGEYLLLRREHGRTAKSGTTIPPRAGAS